MEEQFVTYEIALKLKELGFDEEVCALYRHERLYPILGFEKINSIKQSVIAAPLWQQVVDFLREKYLLHIEIQSPDYPDDVNFSWNIHKICEFGSFASGEPFDYYKVREQAILKCIELCQKQY